MRLLVPLLVMAGLLCVATGLLQMFMQGGDACTEQFQCDNVATVEGAMAGATFFAIATVLWGLAGVFTWMKRKFEDPL